MPRKRKTHLSANPWLKNKLLRRLETPEKRALRLEKDRIRTANRRAHETKEEREDRLSRGREAARSRRANAKYTEMRAQRMIAPLEENFQRKGKSKERPDQQTKAMFQEFNLVNHRPKPLRSRGERRQKASVEDNECRPRRYKNTKTSIFSVGSCIPQSNSLQIMCDQQHLAYEALLGQTFLQSQLRLKCKRMCSKTPEQILQLGLVACPGDILWTSPAEEPLADSDDNENDCSLGVECEVTIEEGEELEERKAFEEEKPVNRVETHVLLSSLVENKLSNLQESLAYNKESMANVKTEEEISQPSDFQPITEILRDENTLEEIP